ncbi:MAG: glycosyltransferase family 2 protein [Candidatus Uhrbacteria bacterium]
MQNTWIVIPAYNEEQKISEVVRDAFAFVSNVVVIDDGSQDKTYDTARSTGAWVLHHRINRGQGAALATGIEFALRQGADVIVTFDSDGQMSATDIPKMIEPIESGQAEVVLGSRFVNETAHNMPKLRRLVVKGGLLFTRVLSRIDVTDTHNGFRAFSRKAAEQIQIREDKMTHASEILDQISKKKIKFVECPVTITYTDYSKANGQSNLNAIKIAVRMILSKLF